MKKYNLFFSLFWFLQLSLSAQQVELRGNNIGEPILQVDHTFSFFLNEHAIVGNAVGGNGIRGESSSAAGVFGRGTSGVHGTSTNGFGLFGESTNGYGLNARSVNGHGALFRGDNENGFADIVLQGGNWNNGSDDGVIMINPALLNGDIFLVSNDAVVIELDNNGGETGNFEIWDQDDDTIFEVRENGNVYLNGALLHSSDVKRKEKIITVDEKILLEKLLHLEIYEWQYKKDNRRHIGPMAQEFQKEFELGADNETIAAIDIDGITIAAIQALYLQNQELQSQIDHLMTTVESLKNNNKD